MFDKHIDTLDPSTVSEFTNLLNVMRLSKVEFLISGKTKQKLINKIKTFFTDKQYEQEVNSLSLDTLTKILSDALHFGNVSIIDAKIEEFLSRREGL